MPCLRKLPLVLLTSLCMGAATALTDTAEIPSLQSLGWKERSFAGNTDYSVVRIDDNIAIQGSTAGAASALYKGHKVDLRRTPFLSWKWKINNTFNNRHEQKKRGDDFPARVYVVYRTGPFFWNTLAINYVWSSQYDRGAHWKNAYTSKSHIVVLQSGEHLAGEWVSEKRNVAADFRQYFGIEIDKIDGYAVMVDGDNTGSRATSWFADIDFSIN